MDQEERNEPRASNDSRSRAPVQPAKETPVESKPGLKQRWRDAKPTKSTVAWACVISVILTIVVGFTWGGWVTAGSAQSAAETMAKDAVVQRLVPICVSQFNMDPDKVLKLDELTALTSYQQGAYVRDQGWATISGEEKPDRKVADACTDLLLEMTP